MQFGIFSVGDVTTDPTTGRTPTEHERIKAQVEIAKHADEVGLDVVAFGQHHNPPFVASAPTTTMAFVAAQTTRVIVSTATTLITTTDPVRIAEDYANAPAPCRRADGPDARPRQHRAGVPVVRQGHPPRRPARDRELRPAASAVARERRRLGGPVPHGAPGLHLDAPSARRHPAVRVARVDSNARDRGAGRVLRRRLLREPHLLAEGAHRDDGPALPRAVRALWARPGRPGDRGSRWPGLHASEQPGRGPRVPAVLRQRARVRRRPSAWRTSPARRR